MIVKFLLALSLLLLFSACSGKSKSRPNPKYPREVNTAAISPENSHRKHEAYILTVSDYEGDKNDLYFKGIEKDRDSIDALLRDWGFSVVVETLPMSFETRMHTYAQTLKEEDVFVFYYSGHGTRIPDTSGDEADNFDELIVLSDADTNRFILDDRINQLLNAIKARKLIIFDSCNSGTAYQTTYPKSGASGYRAIEITKPKYMLVESKNLADIASSKSQTPHTDTHGTFVYLGACLDEEESLASANGSLFTRALLQNISKTKPIKTLHQETNTSLKNQFHPTLSSSDERLKTLILKDYLKL